MLEQLTCHGRAVQRAANWSNFRSLAGTSKTSCFTLQRPPLAHRSQTVKPQEFRGPLGPRPRMLRSATAYGEPTRSKGRSTRLVARRLNLAQDESRRTRSQRSGCAL